MAWNILAVIRAALRAEHGSVAVKERESNYHLVQEVASTRKGMMIALPATNWEILERLTPGELADFLREAASQVRLRRHPRARHGSKKPRAQRTGGDNDHVSTRRVLNQEKQ